jgi:hypothetical protein
MSQVFIAFTPASMHLLDVIQAVHDASVPEAISRQLLRKVNVALGG